MIERGDHGSGIKALEDLGPEASARADVSRALFAAYAATKNDREAMRAAKRWLRADPKVDVGSEQTLRTEVRDAALVADKTIADEAFSLLENDMGTEGWDLLYDIAYGASGSQYASAAARAKDAIRKGSRARMSPALAVTADLHAAWGSCGALKGLLDRAVDKGDERTLALLKQLVLPRIQGHFKKVDLLGCLHDRDKTLDKAVASLDEKVRAKKK
jgi:hypothetical protein